jgi:hypothetical protein
MRAVDGLSPGQLDMEFLDHLHALPDGIQRGGDAGYDLPVAHAKLVKSMG